MKKNNCVRLRRLPVMLVASLVFVLALGISGCGTTTSGGSAKKAESQKMTLVHKGKLTVVSDLANPPFDYMEGQTKKGFEVDMKFDSIIPTIKQGGKADVGASNFTITEERQKEIDFTNAYIDSNQGLVTARGAADQIGANTKTLDNASSTIAVQAGTTGESWVKENLPNATVVAPDDPIAALSGVSTGLYKAAVADLPVMQYECKNSYTDLAVAKEIPTGEQYGIVVEIPTGEQYGIVVSKKNPALTKALNKALKQCRKDGTLSKLELKWFGVDYGEKSASTSTASASSLSGDAGSVAVSKATARPNEDGGDKVIGGINTRLTWEATTKVKDGVSSVTLKLPKGASFDGSTTKVTVLEGLKRVNIDGSAKASGNAITIKFETPIPTGSLLRLEITDMKFPSEGGKSKVTGSYTTAAGVKGALRPSRPARTPPSSRSSCGSTARHG